MVPAGHNSNSDGPWNYNKVTPYRHVSRVKGIDMEYLYLEISKNMRMGPEEERR